jgi:hypothetical protein
MLQQVLLRKVCGIGGRKVYCTFTTFRSEKKNGAFVTFSGRNPFSLMFIKYLFYIILAIFPFVKFTTFSSPEKSGEFAVGF